MGGGERGLLSLHERVRGRAGTQTDSSGDARKAKGVIHGVRLSAKGEIKK